MISDLDSFDRKILDLVQRNCQLKAEIIGEMVGLSASAVQRRVKRMKSEGIIVSETAVVNAKTFSKAITFVAGVELERDNYDAIPRLQKWASTRDEIQQIYYVTGDVDLILVIIAEDTDAYDAIAARIMHNNPHIRRISTNVVLRTLKSSLFVPIDGVDAPDWGQCPTS